MEITINVNDSAFNDIIKKELNAFSKEELHDIIIKMIEESFRSSDIMKDLFITEETSRYSSTTKKIPGPILMEAAKKFDLSPAIEELQADILKTLKEHHKELVENLLLSLMINGLCDNYEFRNKLEGIMLNTLGKYRGNY